MAGLESLAFPDLGPALTVFYVSSEPGGDFPLGDDANDGLAPDRALRSVHEAGERAVAYTRFEFDQFDRWDDDSDIGFPMSHGIPCVECLFTGDLRGCAPDDLCMHLRSSGTVSRAVLDFSGSSYGTTKTNHWMGFGGEDEAGNVVIENMLIRNNPASTGDAIGVRENAILYVLHSELDSISSVKRVSQSATSHDSATFVCINSALTAVDEAFRGGHSVSIGCEYSIAASAPGPTNSIYEAASGGTQFDDEVYTVLVRNDFSCGANGSNGPAVGYEQADDEDLNEGDFITSLVDNTFTRCVQTGTERSVAIRVRQIDGDHDMSILGNSFRDWQRAMDFDGDTASGRLALVVEDNLVGLGDPGYTGAQQQLFVGGGKCENGMDLSVRRFYSDVDDSPLEAEFSACAIGGGGVLVGEFGAWAALMSSRAALGDTVVSIDVASSVEIGGLGAADSWLIGATVLTDPTKPGFAIQSPPGEHCVEPDRFEPGFAFLENVMGFVFNRICVEDRDAGADRRPEPAAVSILPYVDGSR